MDRIELPPLDEDQLVYLQALIDADVNGGTRPLPLPEWVRILGVNRVELRRALRAAQMAAFTRMHG